MGVSHGDRYKMISTVKNMPAHVELAAVKLDSDRVISRAF